MNNKDKDIYEGLWKRYLNDEPLNIKDLSTNDLEYCLDCGCYNRDFSGLMHQVAKELEKRKKEINYDN
jgi:hypothetical protein